MLIITTPENSSLTGASTFFKFHRLGLIITFSFGYNVRNLFRNLKHDFLYLKLPPIHAYSLNLKIGQHCHVSLKLVYRCLQCNHVCLLSLQV